MKIRSYMRRVKIKQDEILSTQQAADAAMAELEAEINKKKAQ